jgi:hypothetical protein
LPTEFGVLIKLLNIKVSIFWKILIGGGFLLAALFIFLCGAWLTYKADNFIVFAFGLAFITFSIIFAFAVKNLVNQKILLTDKGIYYSMPKCEEYPNQIPWEHIQLISTGDWLYKSRYIKIFLREGFTVKRTGLMNLLNLKPRNYIVLNVYIFSETSYEIAEKINHIRLKRKKLVKQATNK